MNAFELIKYILNQRKHILEKPQLIEFLNKFLYTLFCSYTQKLWYNQYNYLPPGRIIRRGDNRRQTGKLVCPGAQYCSRELTPGKTNFSVYRHVFCVKKGHQAGRASVPNRNHDARRP